MAERKLTVKRLFRYGLIGLAGLLVLIVLLLVFIALPPGEKIVRGILENQLTSALGQPVMIGDFETNVVSRIRIDSLRIPPREPDTGLGVFINRAEIRYRLRPLLSRTIAIESIRVDSVRLGIVRDSADGFNLALLDSLMAPGPDNGDVETIGSSGWTVEFGPTAVEYLDARYVDYLLPLSAHLAGVSLTADQSDTLGIAFALDSDTGTIRYAELNPLTFALFARGAWMDSATVIDTLRISLGDMALAANGMLSTVGPQPVEFNLQLAGEPGSLLDVAGERFDFPEMRLDGPISIAADITGTLPEPRGRVRVELPTMHTMGMTISEGLLVAEKIADTIVIDTLHAAGFGGTIDGRGRMLIDTVVGGRLDLLLQSVDLADVWQVAYDTTSPYQGELFGDVVLELKGNEFEDWGVTADLRAQNARYRGTPLENLTVALALQDGRVTADVNQDYFRIRADIVLADSTLRGEVRADIQRLEPLAGFLNIGEMTGALTADANLSGTRENPTVIAQLRGNNLTYQGFPVDSLQARLRYADSALFIEQLTAKGSATAYRAIEEIRSGFGFMLPSRAMFMISALAQAADLETPPEEATRAAPRPLFGIESLFGGIDYTLTLSGPIDQLRGRLESDLTGIEYGGYAIDSGRLVASMEGDLAIIDSLRIYRDSLLLQIVGDYNTKTGEGSAIANAYRLGAEPPDDTTAIAGTVAPEPAAPPGYGLVGHMESEFTYATEGSFDVAARGERFALRSLGDLAPDTLVLDGTADFTLTATGPIESLAADIELAITQPRYDEVQLDSISIAGSFNRGDVQIRNFGMWGLDQSLSGRVSAQLSRDTAGNWEVTAETPVAGSIAMEEFNLATVGPFLPEGAAVEGFMWLDLEFDGTLSDPNVTGTLAVDSGQYTWAAEADTIRRITIAGTIADSTLTLDTATALINDLSLKMQGTMTLAPGRRVRTDITITVDTIQMITAQGTLGAGSLDFVARIDSLNLKILEPFVPRVDSLGGFLSARIDLQGSLDEPQMDGRLTATGLTIKPDMIDRPLTDGRMVARFTADNMVIDTLNARMGSGSVAASGTLEFDSTGLASIDMVMSADSLQFTAMEDVKVVVESMRLTYQPSGDYYELGGTIDLGRVDYTRSFQYTELLPFAAEVQQVETELPPLFARTRLNVRLVDSDRIWVNNNLARLRLDADVQFVGLIPDPNLTGRLLVEEGYILYLDRKFEVTEGVAYFIDPNEVNPDITLRAEAKVTTYEQTQAVTYKIILVVTGRLQSPQVELTSEPVLSRADIVSLLTLGATRQQLSGRTGEVLGERAGQIASRQISGFAAGQLGGALGLDRVTVTGNIFNLGDTTGPELIVAQELSEDVTLTYRTRVGHLNEQQISVNWQLSRWWLLEGTTTRRGESALSFTYMLRFR